MVNLKIFKGLFDDKILNVLNIFIKHPEKQYYLSEIARLSEVNVASTFRILNKLVTQEILKVTLIGRVRMYQLAKGEKVKGILSMIENENPLDYFVERVQVFRIESVFLESETNNSYKLVVVGGNDDKGIDLLCREVYLKFNVEIEVLKVSIDQFESMKKFNFLKNKKILWEKDK